MVCRWLYQSIHDLHAISTFDYILPLMVRTFPLSVTVYLISYQPELFRFTEGMSYDGLMSRSLMSVFSQRQRQSRISRQQPPSPDVRSDSSDSTYQPHFRSNLRSNTKLTGPYYVQQVDHTFVNS